MPSTGPTASPASRQRQHPPEDGARVSRLTQHEALRAYELAKACAADYGRVDHPDFLVDVAVAAHDLPKSVRAAVRAARLDEKTVAALIDVTLNNGRMLYRYNPGSFAGDLLLFQAGRGPTGDEESAERWRPYVSGRIVRQVLDFTHGSMTTPEALAQIAPLISERMSRDARPAPTG